MKICGSYQIVILTFGAAVAQIRIDDCLEQGVTKSNSTFTLHNGHRVIFVSSTALSDKRLQF